MKKVLIIPLLIGLSACTMARVPEPIVVPQIVKVPIAAPCVPNSLGGPPEYVDTKEKLKAAQDAAERMQLLYGGRAQREARLNEIEPVIAGCPRG